MITPRKWGHFGQIFDYKTQTQVYGRLKNQRLEYIAEHLVFFESIYAQNGYDFFSRKGLVGQKFRDQVYLRSLNS